MTYVDNLKLSPDYLADLQDLPFNSMREDLFWAFEKMVDSGPTGHWKARFEKIFKSKQSLRYKIRQVVEKLDTKREKLTDDEQILAIFMTLHFKDSDWVFTSIDGAMISYLLNNDSERFSGMSNLLTNVGFWEKVKKHWLDEMAGLNLKDKEGNPISFAARAGPAYLNCNY